MNDVINKWEERQEASLRFIESVDYYEKFKPKFIDSCSIKVIDYYPIFRSQGISQGIEPVNSQQYKRKRKYEI
jgi:hypothetical protein